MSQPCTIPRCTRPAFALCNCCEKHICKFHIDEHCKLLIAQLHPLQDDINAVGHELKSFDIHKTNVEARQKLELWRVECHRKIDCLFEQKCEELEKYMIKKISKQIETVDCIRSKLDQLLRQKEATRQDINLLTSIISQLKKEMKNIEDTYIQIRIRPLIIPDTMLEIMETIRPNIDLSTLSPTCITINHSEQSSSVLASNNKYLLMQQGLNLSLVNQEMKIIKETRCPLDHILDMCWSATLDKFILIDENDLFLIDENLTLMEKIHPLSNKKWLSCTCSDTSLFISMDELGSSMSEFNLSSMMEFIKQWSSPFTCKKDEQIDTIVCSNETIALLIRDPSKKSIRIELRFSATLDYLWSLPLDIKCEKEILFRCCLSNFDEWLVADYEKCRLLHITKYGQLKSVMKYKITPYHIHLFNHNILVVLTKNGKNLHPLV